MSTTIQIRNVPDDLHRKLKARAALESMSLSSYLLSETERLVERPTDEELRRRLRNRTPVNPGTPPGDAVREQRDHS